MAMKSCGCGDKLTIGKWWWLAAISTLVLYALMLFTRWDPIEKDIQSRTQQALVSNDYEWASTDLDYQGRDVILRGEAFNDVSRDQAIALTRSVNGVRIVEPEVGLKALEYGSASWQRKGDVLQMTGEFPDQGSIDRILASAGQFMPDVTIDNQMTVAPVLAPSWTLKGDALMAQFARVERGNFRWSADKAHLTGIVRTEADRAEVASYFDQATGLNVQGKLDLKPYRLAKVSAQYVNGRMTLKGEVPTQQGIDALLAEAEVKVGRANIVNQLKTSKDVEPVTWVANTSQLLNKMPEGSSLQINSEHLVLLGLVDTDEVKQDVIDHANSVLKGAVPLVDKLTVRAPSVVAQDSEAEAEAKLKQIEATRLLREQKEQVAKDKEAAEVRHIAISSCQQEVAATMDGKKIQFATNSATIKDSSHGLLNTIAAVVSKCGDVVKNTRIYISGHTDSRGDAAYNQALSERRAASVQTYLTEAGVAGSLMEAIGQGESQPVASNKKESGRAKNRRIQFDIK